MIIISDTSPIANPIQIDRLEAVFTKIIIPPEVNKEILELEKFGISTSYYQSCDWIEIRKPENESEIQQLMIELDKGESEAILFTEIIKLHHLLLPNIKKDYK